MALLAPTRQLPDRLQFKPHPGQLAILNGLSRFNIARCGRRFGKTKLGEHYLWTGKRGMAAGFPTGWFAPNYKYLADPWREMKEALAPYMKGKDEVERRIDLWNGGSIEMWTCDGEDPARGRKYAKIVIDEAAMIRRLRDKYQKSIRPTLTDYRGGALFTTTPRGRNDLWKMEQDAIELDSHGRRKRPDWAVFHAPTSANTTLRDLDQEVADAQAELPALVFRQEYLAEYVDFGGALVKPEWVQHGLPEFPWPIVLGVDLAISLKDEADYTAIAALSRSPKTGFVYVLSVLRFRLTFNEILKQIMQAANRFHPVAVMIESNQFQAAVVQELVRQTQLPIRGVHRDKDKLTAFLPMVSRYEHKLVYHSPDLPAYFEDELLSFTGGPDDDHDDCIDAISTAFLGLGAAEDTVAVGAPREDLDAQEETFERRLVSMGRHQ